LKPRHSGIAAAGASVYDYVDLKPRHSGIAAAGASVYDYVDLKTNHINDNI
jgi:hypothetical protein